MIFLRIGLVSSKYLKKIIFFMIDFIIENTKDIPNIIKINLKPMYFLIFLILIYKNQNN